MLRAKNVFRDTICIHKERNIIRINEINITVLNK